MGDKMENQYWMAFALIGVLMVLGLQLFLPSALNQSDRGQLKGSNDTINQTKSPSSYNNKAAIEAGQRGVKETEDGVLQTLSQ